MQPGTAPLQPLAHHPLRMDKMCHLLASLLLFAATAQALAPTRLRLLTCDLDDTFWPTAEVVAAANAALYKALEARNADASLLGDTMKRLQRPAGGLHRPRGVPSVPLVAPAAAAGVPV